MDRLTLTLLHVYAAAFSFLLGWFFLAGPLTGHLIMVLAVDAMMLMLIGYGAGMIVANALRLAFGLKNFGRILEVAIGIMGGTVAFMGLSIPYPTIHQMTGGDFLLAVEYSAAITGIVFVFGLITRAITLRSFATGLLPSRQPRS